MDKNNKVSVLMSVYFKEKPEYVDACLESMHQQTYLPDEIVLIKDGPLTEELDQVISNYETKYPHIYKVIPLEKNVGLGVALALGVEACTHPLIARMDTDDIALPERLEKQRNYFIEQPETAIVGSDIIEFEGSIDNQIAKRIVPHQHEEIYQFAKRRNPFNHMTVMYRKDAVLAAGNYQPLNGYEDYYLWVRMLADNAKAYNFNEILVYARGGTDMYERRGGWKYFKDGLAAQKKIYKVGLSSPVDFVIRIGAQTIVNLVPNQVRSNIYSKVLRK